MELNLKDIANGYYNLLLKGVGVPNEQIEELAAKRLEHCDACETNGAPTILGGHCTLCGCLMSAKSRSINAKCPLGKW
jgi:hypothetical protein